MTGNNTFTSFDGVGNQDSIDVLVFWKQKELPYTDPNGNIMMDNSTCAYPGDLQVDCVDNGQNIYDEVYFMVCIKIQLLPISLTAFSIKILLLNLKLLPNGSG